MDKYEHTWIQEIWDCGEYWSGVENDINDDN